MRENKQDIANKLLIALQATSECEDLKSLEYEIIDDERGVQELVIVTFECGHKKAINVTADSGISMIRDITRVL